MESHSDTSKEIDHIENLKRKGSIWGTISALSAISFFIVFEWAEFPSAVLMLLPGSISGCSLIVVLTLNAEAVHKQTNEDLAFIHLQTSLPLGITLLLPVFGIWAIKVAVMALRGTCARSGGTLKETPKPHLIGSTSVHLGMLLLVLTAVIQGSWFICLYDHFIR